MSIRPAVAAAASLLFFARIPAVAQDHQPQSLTIEHPWSLPSRGGMGTGIAFVKLVNSGKTEEKLLKVSSPWADQVTLHENIREGDINRMREVEAIIIPPGQSVEFKPGGMHLMLMGMNHKLNAGDMLPLTLSFAHAGEVKVEAKVSEP